MSYSPRADSLPGRVCLWFQRNDEETLSGGDIAIKFEADPRSVSTLLNHAVTAQLLALTKRRGANYYSAGIRLASAAPAPAPLPPAPPPPPPPPLPAPARPEPPFGSSAQSAGQKRKPPAASLTATEAAEVKIELDVPLQPLKPLRPNHGEGYAALAQRLLPGTSAVLSHAHCRGLQSWARKAMPSAKFTLRVLQEQPDTARIFRIQ